MAAESRDSIRSGLFVGVNPVGVIYHPAPRTVAHRLHRFWKAHQPIGPGPWTEKPTNLWCAVQSV